MLADRLEGNLKPAVKSNRHAILIALAVGGSALFCANKYHLRDLLVGVNRIRRIAAMAMMVIGVVLMAQGVGLLLM